MTKDLIAEKPSGYLIQWTVDGEERIRVQLSPNLEPWLEYLSPKVTPLYPRAQALNTSTGE